MSNVVFWQNMPSHLQSGGLEHFAATWPGKTFAVWAGEIDAGRRGLGWGHDSARNVAAQTLPPEGWREEVEQLVRRHADAIHILSGIGAYAPITYAAELLKTLPQPKIGLMVESAKLLGWRSGPRKLKAWWCYRDFVHRISVVLAMGAQGRSFYRHAGFDAERIMPYMYQCPFGRVESPRPTSAPIRFVYIGQLHHRKGIDLLIRALGGLKGIDGWELTIYGTGKLHGALSAQVTRMGVENRVSIKGVLQASDVVAEISQHDVCCIPSRFDGWGVVTNESLQAGVPVVVSSAANSSELVRASGAGYVFPVGNVAALRDGLLNYIHDPSLVTKHKQRAVEYSEKILPEVVAQYLVAVLQHFFLGHGARPVAPWLDSQMAAI